MCLKSSANRLLAERALVFSPHWLGVLPVSHTTVYPGCSFSGTLGNQASLGKWIKESMHPLSPFISKNSATFLCSSCPLTQWRKVTIYRYHFHSSPILEPALDTAAQVAFLKHKSGHISPLLRPFNSCPWTSKTNATGAATAARTWLLPESPPSFCAIRAGFKLQKLYAWKR